VIAEDYQENYLTGFVKSYRSTMKKGWYKKSEYFHLWHHLLYKASHSGYEFYFNGKNMTLKPGQFVTGRKALNLETGINESKIERILNFFEKNEHQIEQQKTNKNRLITILKWNLYQNQKLVEHQNEQQVNNKRTTSEQQVNTYKNEKNIKNENNIHNAFLEKFNSLRKEYLPNSKGIYRMDDKSKRQLKALVKKGNTLDEIIEAARNAFSDQFHAENGWKFIMPEYITRDNIFTKWINFIKTEKSKGQHSHDTITADVPLTARRHTR